MIAAIELAILQRLRDVAPGLGFAWKTLGTFPDNWEDYLESDAVIACPGAWTVFAGWTSTDRVDGPEGEQLHLGASFGLMLADENLRPDEQYQRHGGANIAAEPGSYRLIIGSAATLAGQMLGLDLVSPIEVGPLRPVAPTAASKKRRMSRFAVELTCTFAIAIAADGDVDPDDLLLLHANWHVAGFDRPNLIDRDPVAEGVQLADDFHADATNAVALQGPEEED